MQNIIRRLFADKNWLEKVFSWLDKEDLALLFERFQASIAWDPSTHHAIVVRMTRLAVGKNWRSATPEQQQELTSLFRDLLVRTYSELLQQPEVQDMLSRMLPGQDALGLMDEALSTFASTPPSQLAFQFLFWNVLLASVVALPVALTGKSKS